MKPAKAWSRPVVMERFYLKTRR